MRDMWRNPKALATQLLGYTIALLFTRNEKKIVSIGEAFLELEPFEHEPHASGSRFNLNLELRI